MTNETRNEQIDALIAQLEKIRQTDLEFYAIVGVEAGPGMIATVSAYSASVEIIAATIAKAVKTQPEAWAMIRKESKF